MKLILATELKSRLMADFGVALSEIEECFLNRKTSFEQSNSGNAEANLIDATTGNFFFIAKTDRGRLLKVKFNIKDKLLHILQLPERAVTMEQEGVFCEVTAVESIVRVKQTGIHD
ncbi:hypothetical protein BH10CYA1_BH10CYA1_27490 [soil metagenome]